MKIYTLLIVVILFSCNCKKNLIANNNSTDTINAQKIEKILQTICPENGKCTTTIFRNQSLDVNTDEFGAIYYNKIQNNDKSVILFSYSRNVPEGVQDGSYREEIVFEIDNSITKLSLKNEQLQDVKMLFGRFCYCKGQTGNFLVVDGQLNFIKKNNKIQFDLTFKNNKVPQKLSLISESIQ